MAARYESPEQAVKVLQTWHIQPGMPARAQSNTLAREVLINVQITGAGNYMLLCTPLELEALAVGFAFSEGLLTVPGDIVSVTTEPTGFWSAAVCLTLREPPLAGASRNLIVTSSCGLCGSQIEKEIVGPEVGSELRIEGLQLIRIADRLLQHQSLFEQTGGTHAAGIFNGRGELVSYAEDGGRHNALDKAVGKLLLAGRGAKGCGVIITGRISYELVAKSARAGLEVVAGISAPSALATDAAAIRNITLCGFVRADRLTVYTHPFRVAEVGVSNV